MAQKVLVTGATGFVATEMVKQLLEKGYNVVGTVRSASNPRADTLKALAKALPGQLELIEADLLESGAFDEAVQGCTFIFHMASPFKITAKNPQEEIIDVALKGTENVLSSAAKHAASIKRIILTSSVAAVHGEYAAPPCSGLLYSEQDFNETSTIGNGQAYHLSKVAAEKAAWEYCKARNLDLVAICPNFVLGPMISPEADSLSIGFIKSILEGGPIEGTPCIVDVRDVAAAHLLAAETPSASGRYIVSNRQTLTCDFISETLRKRFPEFVIQEGAKDKPEEKMDNKKAHDELGLQLHHPASTLIDMAVTAVQLGIAKPKLIS